MWVGRLAGLAVIALVVGTAAPARAQDAGLRKRIVAANELVNQARRYIKNKVGLTVGEYDSAIGDIETRLTEARGRITPDMKKDAEGWKVFSENLADAEDYLAHMKRALDCARAREPIAAAHRDRKPASEAQHAAFDATVAAFTAAAGKGWEKPVEFLQGDATALRAESARLAEQAVRAEQAARERAAEKARQEVVQTANQEIRKLEAALARDELTTDSIDPLVSAAAAVAGVDPEAGKFYAHEVSFWKVAAAMTRPDAEAQAELVQLTGGRAVGAGTTRGRKATIKVKVAADECVMVFARLVRYTGNEKIEEDGWVEGKGSDPLQRIWVRRSGKAWDQQLFRGFCALRGVDTSWTAAIDAAGTTNGLRWVAVAWPRAAMPAFLTAELSLSPGDPCDFDHWKANWLHPVPGTVLWEDGNPVLVTGPPDGPYYYRGISLHPDSDGNRSIKPLTASPTKVRVTTTLGWKGCPDNYYRGHASADLSRKILACDERIDGRFASRWKKINALRDAADRRGGISPAAEQMASRLEDEQDRAYQHDCGPMEKQAAAQAQKTFDALVDALTANPPADTTGRVEMIRLLGDAPYRPSR